MIEIKNKTRGPVQVLVKSATAPRAFTTLIVAGIGAGFNVVNITDEQAIPEILERLEKIEMISTRYVPNARIEKN